MSFYLTLFKVFSQGRHPFTAKNYVSAFAKKNREPGKSLFPLSD
jgi:hypothetical protein